MDVTRLNAGRTRVALLAAVACAGGIAGAARAAAPTIYVADAGSSSVVPVDASAGTLSKAISLSGLVPVSVAVTPNGKTVFVVGVGSDQDGSPGSVIAIDTATRDLANPLKVGTSPQEILITPDGKTAYVLDGIDAATTPATTPVTVLPISTATHVAGKPIKVGTLPNQMVMSPNGKLLYVLDTSSSGSGKPTGITPVDTATNAAGRAIDVAAVGVVFAPSGTTAYALTSIGVVPIDTATGKAGKNIALGGVPVAAAVTPDGKTVEVLRRPASAAGGWTLTAVDTHGGKVGKSVALGAHPGASAGAVAIAPDGASAFALVDGSSTRAGSLVPVGLPAGSAGKAIAAGRDASMLELSSDGADVYVLDGGTFDGVGSPKNTQGAIVPVVTATGKAGKAIAVGLAPLAFAVAPASSSATSTAAASGAKNLVVTAAVRSELVAAFAPAHHVPVAEVEGTYPGSVYYAYDSATSTYWAVASFVPAAADTPSVKNTFQDAGSNGIFSRSAGGAWRFRGSGAPILCVEERDVPAAVLDAWSVAASSPSCPAH